VIKLIVNLMICKIKNHIFVEAGTCPYSGNTYNVCTRCTKMIKVDKAS
jgi:hypothetical protein